MNFSRLIPDAIRCLLSGKRFEIRSDGTPQRDYLYVKDAVEGYITLAEQMERGEVLGQAFNFGSCHPVAALNLFYLIARLCRKPRVRPKILGTAANEINRQYLLCAKARELLGWRPHYSLEKGLKETIAWYTTFLKKTRGR